MALNSKLNLGTKMLGILQTDLVKLLFLTASWGIVCHIVSMLIWQVTAIICNYFYSSDGLRTHNSQSIDQKGVRSYSIYSFSLLWSSIFDGVLGYFYEWETINGDLGMK